MITHDEVLRHFNYNPDSGEFTRLIHTNNRSKTKCGSVKQLGYIEIGCNGKVYLAHRLAWLYMTGSWPERMIDHIDGNPSNNSWSNLRQATAHQNTMNTKSRVTNRSGVKGVCWNKKLNKWQAGIKYNYKSIHLGLFDNIDEAAKAVSDKRNELHGEYARQR